MRGGKADTEELIEQLVRLGATRESAVAYLKDADDGENQAYPLHPDNRLPLIVTQRSMWQWVFDPGDGKRLDFDHEKLCSTLSLMGIKRKEWPKLFEQLLICRDVVLKHQKAGGA